MEGKANGQKQLRNKLVVSGNAFHKKIPARRQFRQDGPGRKRMADYFFSSRRFFSMSSQR
jgi:hypothetical protein